MADNNKKTLDAFAYAASGVAQEEQKNRQALGAEEQAQVLASQELEKLRKRCSDLYARHLEPIIKMLEGREGKDGRRIYTDTLYYKPLQVGIAYLRPDDRARAIGHTFVVPRDSMTITIFSPTDIRLERIDLISSDDTAEQRKILWAKNVSDFAEATGHLAEWLGRVAPDVALSLGRPKSPSEKPRKLLTP